MKPRVSYDNHLDKMSDKTALSSGMKFEKHQKPMSRMSGNRLARTESEMQWDLDGDGELNSTELGASARPRRSLPRHLALPDLAPLPRDAHSAEGV